MLSNCQSFLESVHREESSQFLSGKIKARLPRSQGSRENRNYRAHLPIHRLSVKFPLFTKACHDS